LLVTFTIVLNAGIACANLQNEIEKDKKESTCASLNLEAYGLDCQHTKKMNITNHSTKQSLMGGLAYNILSTLS
jgi:hypothetical protein